LDYRRQQVDGSPWQSERRISIRRGLAVGERDDRRVARARIGPQPKHDIRRTQLWQLRSQDNDVGSVHQRFAECRDTIGSFHNIHAGLTETGGQRQARPRIVVDDHDAETLQSGHFDLGSMPSPDRMRFGTLDETPHLILDLVHKAVWCELGLLCAQVGGAAVHMPPPRRGGRATCPSILELNVFTEGT
jgi:hypothetical protein